MCRSEECNDWTSRQAVAVRRGESLFLVTVSLRLPAILPEAFGHRLILIVSMHVKPDGRQRGRAGTDFEGSKNETGLSAESGHGAGVQGTRVGLL